MKYIVTEIQSFPGGATSTPSYAYDSANYGGNEEKALNAAKSKYYQLLSGAAVSQVPVHSAILYMDNGSFYAGETFSHPQEEPAPEESAEPEA